MNRVAQLIQVVQVIFPLLVQHLKHEVGQQLLREVLRSVALLDFPPRFQLGLEGLTSSPFDRLL